MARSDKVAMCIMRYMVPLIFVVEFIAIAALAWSLGGPRWAFGAVAAVALMLLFSYAFCCMAAVSDGCGPDDSEGKRCRWPRMGCIGSATTRVASPCYGKRS